MPRKVDPALIDYAADLVRNGEMLKIAAEEIGVHPSILSKKLSEIGVSPRRGRGRPERIDLPINQILTMYQNGESENAIAEKFNVSRGTIRKRLIENNINPRSQSEAEKLKWSKMGDQARANQVKAAHQASRGKSKNPTTLAKSAKSRERTKRGQLIGPGETELLDLLNDRGINAIHQKAVGIYNVDITVGRVAVELTRYRGRYVTFNPKEIKRAEYLIESGFRVIAIEFDTIDTLIECADNVITFIDEAGRLKPGTREYWVIGCRKQDCTVIRNKSGQFASVPSPVQFITRRSVVQIN